MSKLVDESASWVKSQGLQLLAGGASFRWGQDGLLGACPFGAVLYREGIVTEAPKYPHYHSVWSKDKLSELFGKGHVWMHIAFFSWHYDIQFLRKDMGRHPQIEGILYIEDSDSKDVLRLRRKHLKLT